MRLVLWYAILAPPTYLTLFPIAEDLTPRWQLRDYLGSAWLSC